MKKARRESTAGLAKHVCNFRKIRLLFSLALTIREPTFKSEHNATHACKPCLYLSTSIYVHACVNTLQVYITLVHMRMHHVTIFCTALVDAGITTSKCSASTMPRHPYHPQWTFRPPSIDLRSADNADTCALLSLQQQQVAPHKESKSMQVSAHLVECKEIR